MFTHVREVFDEVNPILDYLEAIGSRTSKIEDPDGNEGGAAAVAYFFDLTNPIRLSAANAEQFDVKSSYQGNPAEAGSTSA